MTLMKCVELGGGDRPKFRPNIDVRPGPKVDQVMDFNKPLDLLDNTYDLVYCEYVIEHVSWRNVKSFIKEIFRICAHGGTALIITANLHEQCKLVAESLEWQDNFSCMIFGDLDYSENSHKCGFSPVYVKKLFLEAGFSIVDVNPLPWCKTDMVINAKKDDALKVKLNE